MAVTKASKSTKGPTAYRGNAKGLAPPGKTLLSKKWSATNDCYRLIAPYFYLQAKVDRVPSQVASQMFNLRHCTDDKADKPADE
jgi:hypothetical protein